MMVFVLAVAATVVVSPAPAVAAGGELDPTFGDGGRVMVRFTGPVPAKGHDLVVQPDGKLVLVGTAGPNIVLARYTANGALDTTFGSGGITTTNGFARAAAVQADGRIVVTGGRTERLHPVVWRYTASGQLDGTFGEGGSASAPVTGFGEDVAVQADGRIVVAAGDVDLALARFTAGGMLDGSFGFRGTVTTDFGAIDGARALAIQPDGRLVLGGGTGRSLADEDFVLARYTATGALDTTFDGDGKVTTDLGRSSEVGRAIALQQDGKILLAGESGGDLAVVRYTSGGQPDPAFDTDGRAMVDSGLEAASAESIDIQPDGNIMIGGRSAPLWTQAADFVAARLTTTGALDPTFDGDGSTTTDFGGSSDGAAGMLLLPAQSGTRIVLGGSAGDNLAVAGYSTTGALDPTFGVGGKVTTEVVSTLAAEAAAAALQDDGKVVLAGTAGSDVALSRHTPDGALDPTFGGDGRVVTDFDGQYNSANGVAIAPDGKIVVGGDSQGGFLVARYTTDGTLDPTFGTGGKVEPGLSSPCGRPCGATAVAVQGDGKIVAVGQQGADFFVGRYDGAGRPDPTFGSGGSARTDFGGTEDKARAVTIQPDGKILVGGSTGPDLALARYTTAGAMDATFGQNGKVRADAGSSFDAANGLAIDPEGRILVSGEVSGLYFRVLGFTPEGALDPSFGEQGKATSDFSPARGASAVGIGPDGKIVAAGFSSNDFATARYTGGGQPDPTFSDDGMTTTDFGGLERASAVVVQADGRVIAAGTNLSDQAFSLVRYEAGILSLASRRTPENTGTEQTVTARLQDQSGAGLPNVPVRFRVTGANPRAATVVTNSDGKAALSYVGTTQGVDTIQAFADTNNDSLQQSSEPNDTALKRWRLPPRCNAWLGHGFFAYAPGFTGGVSVASGDLDGDGCSDLITGAGPGGGPHVRAFSGTDGRALASFFSYAPGFTGGVSVASGDVNGDGIEDIVTGAGPGGGPHVRAFSGTDGRALASFFAYTPDFRGGVSVASGDVNGDGIEDIVTGAGRGGGPHVRAFSGADGGPVASFFAYGPDFRGGVSVASGDVNVDGIDDIVTGAGPGGGPHVRAFSGAGGRALASFFAYGPDFRGGVSVASGDVNGDGIDDIVTGAGPGGGPHVRAFSGAGGRDLASFFAYAPGFTGGVFVSSGDVNGNGRDDIVTGAGRSGGPHVRAFD